MCSRPLIGSPCFRCGRLGKKCLTIPGPYEREILQIREAPKRDVNPVVATRAWTRRVEVFLRKAMKEPESIRLLRSILHHTFELRNEFRRHKNYADLLPPSAEIVWPILSGQENGDQEGDDQGTAGQAPSAGHRPRTTHRVSEEPDDYGLTIFR
ncbi:hypothetical protein BDW68DRAFT_172515 [Aspergillus falconensis]